MTVSRAGELAVEARARAGELGFDLVGITTAEAFPNTERTLIERIDSGLYRGLDWLTANWVDQACDPRSHFASARSLLSLGMSYCCDDPPVDWNDGRPRGLIARFAWGTDYHQVIGQRLRSLADWFCESGATQVKTFVDTGRLVERAVARRAGLGWSGKNSALLNERFGSWVFLGEVLTDLDLEPDRPVDADCQGCSYCLDACPTGALIAPGVLDSSRCISFLTIEMRGMIPVELRPLLGTRIFGCDACQNACPINHRAERAGNRGFQSGGALAPRPELLPLLTLSPDQFRRRFRRTAIARAKRSGFLRNVAVALGNLGDPQSVPALALALCDCEPLVRGHVAWALGRIGGRLARQALSVSLAGEMDAAVRIEIERALELADSRGNG